MPDTEPTFQEALDFFLDESQDINGELLFRYSALLSDMSSEQLESLLRIWGEIVLTRRHALLAHLKSILEIDLLLSFEALGRALLSDDDVITRTYAIRLLDECENDDLVAPFLKIATEDPELEPRAEVISSLGAYIYYGEMEELAEENLKKIEELLLQIAQGDEKTELKMRAVESLGFSSREEVPDLIRAAWQRESSIWKASALSAMGRSYDEGWEENVLEGLLHESEIIRLAAAKAAGGLALPSARPILLDALREEDDEIVLRTAIWSLSEIGGEDVREFLLSLLDQYDDGEEDENEEQIEYIEEALANLDFTEDVQNLGLFDFDSEDLSEALL